MKPAKMISAMLAVTTLAVAGANVAFATTVIADETGIAIDRDHFPDPSFRSYIREFDVDGDGILSEAECAAVTKIDIEEHTQHVFPVRSVEGISYFQNLTELNVNRSEIHDLDISQNTGLVTVNCHGTSVSHINIGDNENLERFYCGFSFNLHELDISESDVLTYAFMIGEHSGNYYGYNGTSFYVDVENVNVIHPECITMVCEPLEFVPEIVEEEIPEVENEDTEVPEEQPQLTEEPAVEETKDEEIIEEPSEEPYEEPSEEPSREPARYISGKEAYITRLYSVVLGQNVEKEQIDKWMTDLTNNEITASDMAREFLNSEAFAARDTSDEYFVDALYRALFEREADEEGRKFWIGQLESGVSRADVIESFLSTTEWSRYCDTFDMNV